MKKIFLSSLIGLFTIVFAFFFIRLLRFGTSYEFNSLYEIERFQSLVLSQVDSWLNSFNNLSFSNFASSTLQFIGSSFVLPIRLVVGLLAWFVGA